MPPEKLVLAFDTSAAHCAVALLLGDRVLVKRLEEMHEGQAERLFPLMEEVLTEAGKNWTDIDAIGVGIGPGNFTGIRLSVSAARGLALSLGIPAIGVSVLEAMRFGASGLTLSMIDARRDQLYVQSSAGEAAQVVTTSDLSRAHIGKVSGCIGHRAQEVAGALNARETSPVHPLAVAIARIAAARIADSNSRPAPLYLKSADAAPSRDAPPTLLS